eukprot:7029321-Heterocapsa_arctica.AAC.1
MNSVSNLNWMHVKAIRKAMTAEPQCLWTTGVITKEWTALVDSDFMKQQDYCQPCTEHTKKVYIDGSATTIGASAYAGWGMWSPDNPDFTENGPLKGRDQGADRAEVRALVAALEKATVCIEVITDN